MLDTQCLVRQHKTDIEIRNKFLNPTFNSFTLSSKRSVSQSPTFSELDLPAYAIRQQICNNKLLFMPQP